MHRPLLAALLLVGCGPSLALPPPAPVATAVAAPAPDEGVPLALTLDDLPYVGPTARGATPGAELARIVEVLKRAEVPATGFATCHRISATVTLEPWTGAGLAVGNHSTRHESVDALGREAFVADVRACRDQLAALTGAPPRWFRYPMLQTGAERGLRDDVARNLAALGHRNAPVSIDVSDWVLAPSYAAAVDAGDAARASAIADAYLAHVERAARRYRKLGRARAGREIAQILLLHANSLASDHLERVIAMLRQEGFRFVSLDEAMADAIYARPDEWVDPVGASWLLRIAPPSPEEWGWDRGQEQGMSLRFGLSEEPAGEQRIGPRLRALKLEGVPAWRITHTEPVAANSLLYLTGDGSTVLANTPMTPAATEDLLDWISARFGRAPALATVSHFHFDASAGIGPLQDAGVPIAVSDLSARLLQERGPALQAGMVEMYGDAFRGWSVAVPHTTFPLAEGFTTRIGGTEVRVLFPGAAHTADNVVTFFPESGVLYGGCMVKGGDDLGYVGDAVLGSWAGAIAVLEGLGAKVVVPGHGGRVDGGQLGHTRGLVVERR